MNPENIPQNVQETLADAAAGVSVAAFLGITLAEWEAYINIGVGVIGMVAGAAAAWWHIERAVEARRVRRQRIQQSRNADSELPDSST